MKFQPEEDASVAEQSAAWFTTLLDGNEQSADFFAWLARSPSHVEAFLRVLNTAGAIAVLSTHERARIEQLAYQLGTQAEESPHIASIPQRRSAQGQFDAEDAPSRATAADAHSQPHELPESDDRLTARSHSHGVRALSARWVGRIAAMLLVGVGAFLWLNTALGGRTYSTGVGEQRVLSLPDGSTVAMNTDSEISVRLTQSARSIRLVRGEALFTVAHEPTRPFDVHVEKTVIRALGTEFDVYRQPEGTRVAVISGLVQVSTGQVEHAFPIERLTQGSATAPNSGSRPADTLSATTQLVAAGEAAVVSTSGDISRRPAVNPDKAVAWRRSRLVFEEETLANIAAEFNRYNSLKIRVSGTAADQHFSGTFDAHAPQAVMQILAADSALRVERMGDEIIIRAREEPEAEKQEHQNR